VFLVLFSKSKKSITASRIQLPGLNCFDFNSIYPDLDAES